MNDEFARCKAVLSCELEALAEVGAAQALVSEAVQHRNWVDFDASIRAVNELARRVENLEQERTALMQGAGAHGFYDFALRFTEDERRILCGLYRQVRLDAASVRFSAEALASYLGEARTVVSGVLEAAFPEKRGKIYGKSGMERAAKIGGVVLDRRF
jgi:hypothetical protein